MDINKIAERLESFLVENPQQLVALQLDPNSMNVRWISWAILQDPNSELWLDQVKRELSIITLQHIVEIILFGNTPANVIPSLIEEITIMGNRPYPPGTNALLSTNRPLEILIRSLGIGTRELDPLETPPNFPPTDTDLYERIYNTLDYLSDNGNQTATAALKLLDDPRFSQDPYVWILLIQVALFVATQQEIYRNPNLPIKELLQHNNVESLEELYSVYQNPSAWQNAIYLDEILDDLTTIPVIQLWLERYPVQLLSSLL